MEEELPKMFAGLDRETPRVLISHRVSVLLDIQKKRREEKELETMMEEKKQKLESFKTQIEETQDSIKRLRELQSDFKLLQREEDPHRAERERKSEEQREEEERRLKEEVVNLTEKREELKLQIKRRAVFDKYMEKVVRFTKFEEAQQLTSHVENLLHFREQLCQREAESDGEVEEKKKTLSALKEQHHLVQLQGNNRLSLLQSELSTALSEASTWEKRWNHIQETAAKKTLQLGEIKMSVLNLHEMTGGNKDEEEAVEINDTDGQLDKVKIFIKDHDEFLRLHTAKTRKRADKQGKSHKS